MSAYAPRHRDLLEQGFSPAVAREIERLEARENDLLDLLCEQGRVSDRRLQDELDEVQGCLAELTTRPALLAA